MQIQQILFNQNFEDESIELYFDPHNCLTLYTIRTKFYDSLRADERALIMEFIARQENTCYLLNWDLELENRGDHCIIRTGATRQPYSLDLHIDNIDTVMNALQQYLEQIPVMK